MAISSKENFEQVGIQVFAASMFSYFVSGTLDLDFRELDLKDVQHSLMAT